MLTAHCSLLTANAHCSLLTVHCSLLTVHCSLFTTIVSKTVLRIAHGLLQDFTAEMMHKDISLGLDLGKKYGVPQPCYEFVAQKYVEAMDKYGKGSGSGIPCRMAEDAAGIRLIDDQGEDDLYPGNSVSPTSHRGAFKDWSYTTELNDGSYTIVHTVLNLQTLCLTLEMCPLFVGV